MNRPRLHRWTPGTLADRMSRLVFGVDDYNRDAVRTFADEVEAMQQERDQALATADTRVRAAEAAIVADLRMQAARLRHKIATYRGDSKRTLNRWSARARELDRQADRYASGEHILEALAPYAPPEGA